MPTGMAFERLVRSRYSCRRFLPARVPDADVEKILELAQRTPSWCNCQPWEVLLIGGDEPQARGPYQDGAALLREGVFAQYGVREVGVPGYPEGHPRIGNTILKQALQDKLALAGAQGLGTYMVTQFSFAPARVVEYCANLAREMPALPVYVGLAGPTEARTLLRFAQRCGVSASPGAVSGADGWAEQL